MAPSISTVPNYFYAIAVAVAISALLYHNSVSSRRNLQQSTTSVDKDVSQPTLAAVKKVLDLHTTQSSRISQESMVVAGQKSVTRQSPSSLSEISPAKDSIVVAGQNVVAGQDSVTQQSPSSLSEVSPVKDSIVVAGQKIVVAGQDSVTQQSPSSLSEISPVKESMVVAGQKSVTQQSPSGLSEVLPIKDSIVVAGKSVTQQSPSSLSEVDRTLSINSALDSDSLPFNVRPQLHQNSFEMRDSVVDIVPVPFNLLQEQSQKSLIMSNESTGETLVPWDPGYPSRRWYSWMAEVPMDASITHVARRDVPLPYLTSNEDGSTSCTHVGQTCEDPKECCSHLCGEDKTCSQGTKERNVDCSHDEECASFVCTIVRKTGRTYGSVKQCGLRSPGEACKLDEDCEHGMCQKNTYSSDKCGLPQEGQWCYPWMIVKNDEVVANYTDQLGKDCSQSGSQSACHFLPRVSVTERDYDNTDLGFLSEYPHSYFYLDSRCWPPNKERSDQNIADQTIDNRADLVQFENETQAHHINMFLYYAGRFYQASGRIPEYLDIFKEEIGRVQLHVRSCALEDALRKKTIRNYRGHDIYGRKPATLHQPVNCATFRTHLEQIMMAQSILEESIRFVRRVKRISKSMGFEMIGNNSLLFLCQRMRQLKHDFGRIRKTSIHSHLSAVMHPCWESWSTPSLLSRLLAVHPYTWPPYTDPDTIYHAFEVYNYPGPQESMQREKVGCYNLTLSKSWRSEFDGDYQYVGQANGKPHWMSDSGKHLYWGPSSHLTATGNWVFMWLLDSEFRPERERLKMLIHTWYERDDGDVAKEQGIGDEEDIFKGDNDFQWYLGDFFTASVLRIEQGPLAKKSELALNTVGSSLSE